MRLKLLSAACIALNLCACNSPAPPPATSQTTTHFETSTSVKELMGWMIDPSAGALWASTGTVDSAQGSKTFAPTTDEEWNRLRSHAVIVAEAGNLLMLDGRAKDQDEWLRHARGMTDAAHAVLEAIEAKDAQALFNSGGDLYQVCTDCHAKYLMGPAAGDAQKK